MAAHSSVETLSEDQLAALDSALKNLIFSNKNQVNALLASGMPWQDIIHLEPFDLRHLMITCGDRAALLFHAGLEPAKLIAYDAHIRLALLMQADHIAAVAKEGIHPSAFAALGPGMQYQFIFVAECLPYLLRAASPGLICLHLTRKFELSYLHIAKCWFVYLMQG